MKRKQIEIDVRVKKKILGLKEFGITYLILMLLVGMQVGIIVIPAFHEIPVFFQVNIILLYWAVVAFVFCLITNWQIRKSYDLPMRRLSEAAKR